jgi:hypothetical protein
MPAIDQAQIADFVKVGLNGNTVVEQGKALEDLVCYLFNLIPGVSITHRNELNAFDTEEIDIAVWNDGGPDGLSFQPNIILIECKNWSARVGSGEVAGLIRSCETEVWILVFLSQHAELQVMQPI